MKIILRQRGVTITKPLKDFIERRIQFALGRFSGRIRSVCVRLEDINGPRGGVDKSCRIEIDATGSARIHVQEQQANLFSAIALAVARAGRTVERHVTPANDWRRLQQQVPGRMMANSRM